MEQNPIMKFSVLRESLHNFDFNPIELEWVRS